MGLLFMDGFDQYGQGSDLAGNWPQNASLGSIVTWNATGGVKNNGPCVSIVSGTTNILYIGTPLTGFSVAPGTAVGVCFWFKCSSAPAAAAQFLSTNGLINSASGNNLRIETSGVIGYVGGNTLRTSGSTNVCDGNWHFVEWTDTTNTGTTKCYVDNTVQWNGVFASASQTRNFFNFGGITGRTYSIEDFFIIDSSSPGPVASDIPYGSRVITTLLPNGDDTVQFTATGGGGTNSGAVDDVAMDDDTSYVQDQTSGHTDLYTYANMGFTPNTVNAVQVVSRIKNPGGGTINFQTTAKSSATSVDGSSTLAPPFNYSNFKQILNQDPNGPTSWSGSGVDGLKAGIKVV